MISPKKLGVTLVGLLFSLGPLEPRAQADPAEIFLQTGHAGLVWGVAFSPDGKFIASAGDDATVKLWEAASGELLHTFEGYTKPVRNVAFSRDGHWLASAGGDGLVKVWEIPSRRLAHTLTNHTAYVVAVAFSPDGRTLGSASVDQTVRLWDLTTGALRKTFSQHTDKVYALAFSPDGQQLASGGADRTILLQDLGTGNILHTFQHAGPVIALAFAPGGNSLASASWDQTVKLWDPHQGTLLRTLNFDTQVEWVTWSHDGRRLAVAGGLVASIWEARDGRMLQELAGHNARVQCVDFSPDDRLVATAGFDLTVKLWETGNGKLRRTFGARRSITPGSALAFSPDGQLEACASPDTAVQLFDARTGEWQHTLVGHAGKVLSLAFSPDSQTIASGGADQTIRLWDARTGKLTRAQSGHGDWIVSLAFSPDGSMLASASGRRIGEVTDKSIKLWGTRDGTLLHSLTGHTAAARCVVFNPNGQQLVTAGADGLIKFWDPHTGLCLRTLTAEGGAVETVAFSPNGRWLAGGGLGEVVQIWETSSDLPARTFPGHGQSVSALAFSPDSRLLASGGREGAVRLWEIASGKELAVWNGHRSPISSVAFHPDGNTLVSSSDDGVVKHWDLASQQLRFDRVHLPGNEWFLYQPGKLYYAASAHGDDFAAVRFDNRLTAVYPLTLFRNELRRTPTFVAAGTGPTPAIHPKPFRRWWNRVEDKGAWTAGGVMLCGLSLGVAWLWHRNWRPVLRLRAFWLRARARQSRAGGSLAEAALFSSFAGSDVGAASAVKEGAVLLNRYEVRQRIGAGGMAEVFAAFDQEQRCEIAIKVMSPNLLDNARAQERFLAEARLATALAHPNIVIVHALERVDHTYFLTMERVLGRTLRRELIERKAQARPFDLAEARRILSAVCAALTYGHRFMVHRDVKPENIWLGSDGQVKLMDFGIAHSLDAAHLTLTGALLGTPYYMAPEQLQGASRIDHRADQYAVAVVLYEMLTGQILAGMARPVKDLRPDVPAAMSDAISKALAPHPDDRFETLSAFATAIG